MIKIIKLLIAATTKREEAYAAFLGAAGSAVVFGTAGMLLLKYLRHIRESNEDDRVEWLENRHDAIEKMLIDAGLVSRADIQEHGTLVALRNALKSREASPA